MSKRPLLFLFFAPLILATSLYAQGKVIPPSTGKVTVIKGNEIYVDDLLIKPLGVYIKIMPGDDEIPNFLTKEFLNRDVILKYAEQPFDSYGFLYAEIYRAEDGLFLNEQLIARGYGFVDEERGSIDQFQDFKQKEEQAWREKKGVWSWLDRKTKRTMKIEDASKGDPKYRHLRVVMTHESMRQEKDEKIKAAFKKVTEEGYKQNIGELEPICGSPDDGCLKDLIAVCAGEGDLGKAIKYQKKLIANGNPQTFHNDVISLWDLQEKYRSAGRDDENVLSKEFLIAPQDLDQVELKYKAAHPGTWISYTHRINRTTDREPREIHVEKALFLFKRMYFLAAEDEFKKALGFPEKKDKTGGTTSDWLIRNYLRNLYILEGEYDKAVEENNWLIAHGKVKGEFYKGLENTATTLLRAKELHLSPREIEYKSDKGNNWRMEYVLKGRV